MVFKLFGNVPKTSLNIYAIFRHTGIAAPQKQPANKQKKRLPAGYRNFFAGVQNFRLTTEEAGSKLVQSLWRESKGNGRTKHARKHVGFRQGRECNLMSAETAVSNQCSGASRKYSARLCTMRTDQNSRIYPNRTNQKQTFLNLRMPQ